MSKEHQTELMLACMFAINNRFDRTHLAVQYTTGYTEGHLDGFLSSKKRYDLLKQKHKEDEPSFAVLIAIYFLAMGILLLAAHLIGIY